jgi:hypothetical protein
MAACITIQTDPARSAVLTPKRSPPDSPLTDSRSDMASDSRQLVASRAYVPVALVVLYRR